MATIRLDKYLSSQLQISRTDAKKLIRGGGVSLAPSRKLSAETQVDPEADTVLVHGEPVRYRQYLYLMLNKPAGYVSSTEDAGPTVLDLVPPALFRAGLFPAGRLDKDTTGMLLLTDDGDFAHRMLSPARHVEKEYEATLLRQVTPAEQAAFAAGITLGDVLLKPAKVSFLREGPAGPVYGVVLTEGRYHQVKRMFASQGNRVLALRRVRMGGLSLDPALEPGECRELTEEELGRILCGTGENNG